MPQRKITVPLSELSISARNRGFLARKGIRTLNELEKQDPETFLYANGMGKVSVEELKNIILQSDALFSEWEKRQQQIESVLLEVDQIPLDETAFSVRAFRALEWAGIATVGDLLRLSKEDLENMPKIGNTVRAEILAEIAAILAEGKEHYKKTGIPGQAADSKNVDLVPIRKGFDYAVVDLLTQDFALSASAMADWFERTKQWVSSVLDRRPANYRDHWCGKELTEEEREILENLIRDKKTEMYNDELRCLCLNNRRDDFVCVFIYEDQIKCFFLKDLPEELRQRILNAKMQFLTERELAEEPRGTVVSIFRKPYFIPDQPNLFRTNAKLHGMTADEYSIFLLGFPMGERRMITDDQIIAFLEKNKRDGFVCISSDKENQWIRSLASRNGYSLRELTALYGYQLDSHASADVQERHLRELSPYIFEDHMICLPFETPAYRLISSYARRNGLTVDEYLNTLGLTRVMGRPAVMNTDSESDMKVRQSDGNKEEQLFAKYPLIGSCLLSRESIDFLMEKTKDYLDKALKNPSIQLSPRVEMRMSIALIYCAREWDIDKFSSFWSYIALCFGYRENDENGPAIQLLKSSLEHAMKQNNRLFVEDSGGRSFKTTVMIHALTPRKSWWALFEFLFDFYKNNLDWQWDSEDPLPAVMVRSLRQKFLGSEEAEFSISSRAYAFLEGIRKLVVLRPAYTLSLFERLLAKIDLLVKGEIKSSKTYEEQLCEEWFKEKLISIHMAKKQENRHREIALDCSRISVKYRLKNSTEPQLVFPDIRLPRETDGEAVLRVLCGGKTVVERKMQWYGNELGKTLVGDSLSLSDFPLSGDLSVQICYGEEIIYDSGKTLYRSFLLFCGEKEIVSNYKKDELYYVLVIPAKERVDIEHIDITEIGTTCGGWKMLFLELKRGYFLAINGRTVLEEIEQKGKVRVFVPEESITLPRVTIDETESFLALYGSACRILLDSEESARSLLVWKNDERIALSDLPKENEATILFPFSEEEKICHLRIVDIENEKICFNGSFLLAHTAECRFNREFYYHRDDYKDAGFDIQIDHFTEHVSFSEKDEEVHLPFQGGNLHFPIPKITLRETNGFWIEGTSPTLFLGNIPQDSLIKIDTPSNLAIRFTVNGKDLLYDNGGTITLGNVLRTVADAEEEDSLSVEMHVKGAKESESYLLMTVRKKERFLKQPEFWWREQKLFWDQGGGFIGKKGSFSLLLYKDSDSPIELSLNENTESLPLPEGFPVGNYRYEIFLLTGGLFKKEKEKIAEGDCVIGDQNLLRFQGRRVLIEKITDESRPEQGQIPIHPCYIDEPEFLGMEETSEGICPVYRGVLYTRSYYGERYEFSFKNYVNRHGHEKTAVNPVRFIYVGGTTAIITDSDRDGLYFFQNENGRKLTDRAYTKATERNYSIADLYLFRTENIGGESLG